MQHETQQLQLIIENTRDFAIVLLFTTTTYENEIACALNTGAKGWLLKDAPRAELLCAIRKADTPPEGRSDAP